MWLSSQYSATPALVEFSFIHLYPLGTGASRAEGALLPPACLPGMWPAGPHCGRVLCHVNGREVRSEWAEASVRNVWPRCAWGDVTYSNPSEALKVLEAVDLICRRGRVAPRDVLVLTPWASQQRLIISMLSADKTSPRASSGADGDGNGGLEGAGGGLAHFGAVGGAASGLGHVRVALLQDAALMSADVVLLSTVRSFPSSKHLGTASAKWVSDQLGLLADSRFINVALTRARRALCIIGNAVSQKTVRARRVQASIHERACMWPPLHTHAHTHAHTYTHTTCMEA